MTRQSIALDKSLQRRRGPTLRMTETSMKPHVICHMLSSVDGRILSRRWRPKGIGVGGLFERLHDELGCDAWIVGRVTGQEFAKGRSYPASTATPLDRNNHFVRNDAPAYGVVLDAAGKIAWGRA